MVKIEFTKEEIEFIYQQIHSICEDSARAVKTLSIRLKTNQTHKATIQKIFDAHKDVIAQSEIILDKIKKCCNE